MERTRRALSENSLWANPCDYTDFSSSPSQKNWQEILPHLLSQARNAFKTTEKLKDTFKDSQSFNSFDALVKTYEDSEWLRHSGNWYRDEVLPSQKKLHKTVSEEYMNDLMTKIDDVLPAMYKGLKMIVAGLYAYSKEGVNENVEGDDDLKDKIIQIMHAARAVLCYFSDVMRARNLEILPVPDSEIPVFRNSSSQGILLYLDTLKYLEYLIQVFQKLKDESA